MHRKWTERKSEKENGKQAIARFDLPKDGQVVRTLLRRSCDLACSFGRRVLLVHGDLDIHQVSRSLVGYVIPHPVA